MGGCDFVARASIIRSPLYLYPPPLTLHHSPTLALHPLLSPRFEEEELNVQRVKEARDRNHMLQREKKTLRTSMKLENVSRVKRIQEYKRLETLRRIHEGDKRISEMMERKTDIVETRKKNALQVS